MRILIFLFLSFILSSCFFDLECDDVELIWDHEVSKSDTFHRVRKIMISGELMIAIVRSANLENGGRSNSFVRALDKSNGDFLWEWNDAFVNYGASFNCIQAYIYDGVLALCTSNLSYGIDLSTGKTIWHHKSDYLTIQGVRGVNDMIFLESHNTEMQFSAVRACNIYDGNWKEIYRIENKESDYISGSSILPYEADGEIFLAFFETEVYNEPNTQYSWLNLYNYTQRKLEWRSDTIKNQRGLARTTPGLVPIYHNGRIFSADDAIYAFDCKTGKIAWSKYYGNTFSFSNLTLGEGMVYGHNESQFLVGLDTDFGSQRFKTPTGGSASHIDYYEDKVYISAISTLESNRYMIFDGKSGEVLNSIKPPFLKENNFYTQSFEKVIFVDKQTGRQYLFDNKHILCYKALD